MMDIELSKAEEKGLKEGQILMAKAMKSDGADINLIAKYTGLSLEEIENLPKL